MESGIPNCVDARPANAARGPLSAIKTVTWDTASGPDAAATFLAALAIAGLRARTTRRKQSRPAPQVLSCAVAGDWINEPDPEYTPTPVRAQLDLTEDFLVEARDADRDAARTAARRARKLDAARQHGERAVMLSDTGADPGPDFQGWTKSEIAYRGFIPQVACALHISEGAAEGLVTTARTLVHNFPKTLALLDAGDTSYRHAESLVRHSYGLPAEHREEYEEILLPFAKKLTPTAFDNKARRLAESFKEDPLEQRHKEALERRQVTVVPCDDGMAEVRLYVDAVDASAIFNRLTAIGRGLQHPSDGRTLTQLRPDVATALLLYGTTENPGTGAPGTGVPGAVHGFDPTAVGKGKRKRGRKGLGVGIRATVSIHVPVLSILDHSDEPATLEGYGPITMDRARVLMGRGATSFTRILTHPETGAILSVGQEKYRVPAAMRLFLMTRDLTCRFPGCTTLARFCDLDHSDDWQNGGATDAVNLAHLCKVHHALKHHTDWTYTQDEFGVVTWVSPTGATYVTEPETWVQGRPPAEPNEISDASDSDGGGGGSGGKTDETAAPEDDLSPEGFPF